MLTLLSDELGTDQFDSYCVSHTPLSLVNVVFYMKSQGHAPRFTRLVAPSSLIDIGLNVAHRDVASNREALLRGAFEAGVEACICTGTSLKASKEVVNVVLSYRGPVRLMATVGIHPHGAFADTLTAVLVI
jgi:hypothetical protein